MSNRASRLTHRRWALVAILLLAFALRLYFLAAESLWYDETVSVHLASKSIPALVAHTAGDIHPPGYYLLLHAWTRLAGSSDFSVAVPSLFFGMLLVALAYRLGASIFGARTGLLAAFLIAISPYNLWYSQEVRMYTLGAVLGVGLLAAVLAMLTAPPETPPSWSRLSAYVLCGALGLWVLYYFAFLLAAINLMVGVWWLWRRGRGGWQFGRLRAWLGRWALAQGIVLLFYAAWIPNAWRQATNPPVPPWRGFTGLGDIVVETWSALSLGQSVDPGRVWIVLLLFAVLFGLGLLGRAKRPGSVTGRLTAPWLLVGYVFIPVLLMYLASFVTPLYHVRYAFTYSTPFYIVVGAGLAWLWRRWRPAMWFGAAVIIAFSAVSIHAYHTDPHYTSDDHRTAARFVAERWRPGDAVLVNAGYTYTALLTYWDRVPISWRGRLVGEATGDWPEAARDGPVVVQTGTVDGDPSLGWGDPQSDFYAMSREETSEALERLFADFDRVWVYRIYDTVTDPKGYIRAWLDEQGVQFEDQVFTGESQLRVQGFLTGRDPLADAEQRIDATLADGSLRLVASSVAPAEIAVGAALDLALVWHVETPMAQDAILFAGLFDDEGRRWAQTDERPLGSLYPVTAWSEGAIVRTPLRLRVPPGTPLGRYRLEVGWYRFVEGQPVWVPWTGGERLELGRVDVASPEDWWALPAPEPSQPIGLTVGPGMTLLGFDALSLQGYPGDTLRLDLLWQALEDAPQPGLGTLQLTDDSGALLAEASSAPVGGRAPFADLAAGQTIRDPRSLTLPGSLEPGVYNLSLGRQQADGTWLPIRRGIFSLSSTYPLATVRVLYRPVNTVPPTVQHPVEAHFGESIRLVGYDLAPRRLDSRWPLPAFWVILHWQALQPMDARYKIFVHLVGEGGPADIRAQADVYPHLPTTAWTPDEYLYDRVMLELPGDLAPGEYALLLGLYDGATGQRLPVLDAAGKALGDSLLLKQVRLGK